MIPPSAVVVQERAPTHSQYVRDRKKKQPASSGGRVRANQRLVHTLRSEIATALSAGQRLWIVQKPMVCPSAARDFPERRKL